MSYSPRAHARSLAENGYYVLICDSNKKAISKLCPRGYLSATNDPKMIDSWDIPDNATVAIACRQSRLLVVDCDVKNGENGVEEFHRYCNENTIDLSNVPKVTTPSEGLHYYFYLPDGFEHGNGEGSLPKGINIRCAGYVIAFGCVLPNGRKYEHISGSFSSIPYVPQALQSTLKTSDRNKKEKIKKDNSAVSKPINTADHPSHPLNEPTKR